MIEEMRLKKKEIKYWCCFAVVLILGSMLCGGYYWLMVSVEVVTGLQMGIVCILTFCSIATTLAVGTAILVDIDKKRKFSL